MQTDGNLVLYGVDASGGYTQVLWTTATSVAGSILAMQTDGNLVVYAPNGVPQWSSGTRGTEATEIVDQGDGNLVEYAPVNGAWTWWTDD